MPVSKFQIGDPKDLPAPGFAPGVRISTIVSGYERAKRILFTDQFSDAVLLVGPDGSAASIPVHTVYLRTASEPFAAMFSETWNKGVPVRIKDCDETSMCSVLRWIYCEEFVFAEGKLADVLKVAHKYMVHSLITYVNDNFKTFKKESLILSLLSFSFECDEIAIKNKCFSVITKNSTKYLKGDLLLGVSGNIVKEMVKGFVGAAEPLFLFQWILKWSKKECTRRKLHKTSKNQRLVMESFIHMIPFLSMKMTDFAGIACDSGILTQEEQNTILRIMAGASLSTPFARPQFLEPFPRRSSDLYIGSMIAKSEIAVRAEEITFKCVQFVEPLKKLKFYINVPIENCQLFYHAGRFTENGDMITVFMMMAAEAAGDLMNTLMESEPEFDTNRYKFDPKSQDEKYSYLMFQSSNQEILPIIQSYQENRVTYWDREKAFAVFNKIANSQ